VVEEVGAGVAGVAAGNEVLALTRFDHDGVAADYTAVPAELWCPGRRRYRTPRAPRYCYAHSSPGRGCSTTAGSTLASAS
jgi:NADPH:quinone reductase-like Zn-dependent oxidoreductase